VSDALAWDPVAVGHKHPQRRTRVCGKLEASTEFGVDEIGHRAGVEEGNQLLALDGDVEDHGVLGAYPGERVEGHLEWWRTSRSSLRIGVREHDHQRLEHRGSRDLHRHHVVVVEEVEEALAHMPTHVGIITVEAEALTSALLLLSRW
jgi:hypothetical protein